MGSIPMMLFVSFKRDTRTLKTAYREHIYSNEPGTYGAGLAKFDNRGHSGIHKLWMIKNKLWIADIITLYDVGRTVDRS